MKIKLGDLNINKIIKLLHINWIIVPSMNICNYYIVI